MNNVLQEQLKRYSRIELARRKLFYFCKFVDDEKFYNEKEAPYLLEVCDALEEFENDDNEALIICMPPRHGKTRTINNTVDWLLGRNPKYRIIEGSYNKQLSLRSSKMVKNRILEMGNGTGKIVFSEVFSDVTIPIGSGSIEYWGVTGSNESNYLATSPNGTATGIGADFIILDDTIKRKYEAYHAEYLRQLFEDWFTDTLYSRLEGKRKIIVVMTRWATGDMAGRLMQMLDEQGRKYRLVTKKAYTEQTGKMLNDNILNKAQYDLLIRTVGEDIVRANYDQEPIDIKGKLYTHFSIYNSADLRSTRNPNGRIVLKEIRARADTADQGKDYLCMIIYGVGTDNKGYVLDVYYTQDAMEITEKEAAKRLLEYEPYIFRAESNNGGRGWSRNVERNYKEMGGTHTIFKPYTQTMNKEARILSNSTDVMNGICFPDDWNIKWREFYNSMNSYQRQGENEHDDAEDCVTSIAEELFGGRKVLYA